MMNLKIISNRLSFSNNLNKVPPLLWNFRFSSSKIAERTETNNGQVTNLSTLYVPSKYGGEMYQIVKPTVDLEYLLQYSEAIQKSCDIRNIKLNINEVIDHARKWLVLKETQETLERKLRLSSSKKLASNPENELSVESKKECIKELTFCKQELYTLDDIVMPLFALVPNKFHEKTPETFDIPCVIRDINDFPFAVKPHVEIAKSMSCIEFSQASPTAYYLIGQLACLEQAIQSFFEEQLESKNFVPITGVDFAKSFIFEACGKDPYSINDCISLKLDEKEIGQRRNLVGGSSFEIFCASLINMNIGKDDLPIRYYSSGRFYNASHWKCDSLNLFNVVQSNCIHCAIVSEPKDSDICFDELSSSILHCFSTIDLPHRIVHVSAKNLNVTESRKTTIELWSPALNKYVVCGDITQSDAFISKRLQMSYGLDFQKDGYLNVVHGFAINMPVFLGCLIENTQLADGTFLIPCILKQYMFQ